MRPSTVALAIGSSIVSTLACNDCYGPSLQDSHVRLVRRMQPDAENATSLPRSDLAWGQLNIIHTTDTHGWLEGHIKEQNYGADFGDYQSFVAHMKHRAGNMGVDLLVVDTGDLHDGAGLSDAESPDGVLSNPIFENLDYDLLTIGNHELYVSDIAYLTATQFAKFYGEKYISSNVQIYNNATQQYENIANQYRYFTTPHGLRIMAFGFLYDFTGNSNASKVLKAADVVKQQWFLNAVNYTEPIDIFLLIGHNPIRFGSSGSTLGTVFNVIRGMRPDVPVQIFGGHTHIRDFAVYDSGSTGLESGRYCETLGWLAMSGINSSTFNGTQHPHGVANPTQKAVKVPSSTATSTATTLATATATPNPAFSNLVYFRRYIDWNRLSFSYHAVGSQDNTFDYHSGLRVTGDITTLRKQLNLTSLYGCAPQTWCLSCKPFESNGSIYSLLQTALSATVINETRKDIPRLIILNTGSVRFDLVQGPFTFDDSFIVSPFHDTFQYIPNVPYSQAKTVLATLNAGAYQKRNEIHSHEHRDLETRDFNFSPLTGADSCVDTVTDIHETRLQSRDGQITRGINRRATALTPGYTTTDDFGTDGDDTIHSKIPYYSTPNDFQANASFPTDGSTPDTVDVIFLDFIASNVIAALNKAGATYTAASAQQYLDPSFDTNAYLPAYAKIAPDWQANVPNCPVGAGVGY